MPQLSETANNNHFNILIVGVGEKKKGEREHFQRPGGIFFAFNYDICISSHGPP